MRYGILAAIGALGIGYALAEPAPSTTSLGGVKSKVKITSQWIDAIGTDGVPTSSQPACANVSDAAASCSTDATNASNLSSGTVPAARLGNAEGTFISTQTAANASQVLSWTGLTGSDYTIRCRNLLPATAGANFFLQFGESGSAKTSGYQYAQQANGVSGTSNPVAGSTSAVGILVADNVKTSAGGIQALEILVSDLNVAVQHGAVSQGVKASNGGDAYYSLRGGGTYTTDTNAIDSLFITTSAGNIVSGSCTLALKN